MLRHGEKLASNFLIPIYVFTYQVKLKLTFKKPLNELESCKRIFGNANGSNLCSDDNFYQPEQFPISKIKSYPHKKYSYL